MVSSSYSDFQVCEGDNYSCKWFSPLSKLEVVETDYQHDIWDYIVARGQRSNVSYIMERISKWMQSKIKIISLVRSTCEKLAVTGNRTQDFVLSCQCFATELQPDQSSYAVTKLAPLFAHYFESEVGRRIYQSIKLVLTVHPWFLTVVSNHDDCCSHSARMAASLVVYYGKSAVLC